MALIEEPFGFEHLRERGCEERIAIMNQEPQRAEAVIQVHGEVAGLLHRPCPGWSRGHPGQVQPAAGVQDFLHGGHRDRMPQPRQLAWFLRCPQAGFSRPMRTTSVLIEVPVDGLG